MNTKQIQLKHVLDHLKSGETLTSVKARCIYGIQSLSSRISELRKQGHLIDSIDIGGGFVRYSLRPDFNWIKPFTPDPKFGIKFTNEDDDNAPFEVEFFNFLMRYGGLELYIDARSETSSCKEEFTLPSFPEAYLRTAFDWFGPLFKYWGDLDKLWSLKLETLKSTPTTSN